MTFTAHYLETLNRHIALFLSDIQVDSDSRDLEFGRLKGRTYLEWDTQFALNQVSRLFVLQVRDGNATDDNDRFIWFTRGSPIAALKYVGLVLPHHGMAYNCDTQEWERVHEDDEVMAIVKRFNYLEEQALEKEEE